MQRRHGRVLVAKPILCPHAAFPFSAMHGVDEAEALGLVSVRPIVRLVA